MAEQLAAFSTTISNIPVVYPNGATGNAGTMAPEFAVIKSFIASWNAANADEQLGALIVTKQHHTSTYRVGEAQHISVYIFTTAQWNADPKEYKHTVHIFSKNNNVAEGYDTYGIWGKSKKSTITSDVMKTRIDSALGNVI